MPGPGTAEDIATAARTQARLLRRGVAILAALPGNAPVKARLTTDHPLSQSGQPIVMVDYQSYSASEVLWVDASPWARQAAARAGYRVLSDAETSWPRNRSVWGPWLSWEEAEPQEQAR